MTVESETPNPSSPDITVVMPLYNAARTVEATIASVLAQSLTNFELIIIDDGSTDDSLARAMRYAQTDPRVRLVSRKNAGVSSSRNLGAGLGMAPLIAFIDADDLWDPEKLAHHWTCHQARPELAASYARIAFIAGNAEGLGGAKTLSSLCARPLELIDVLGENPVCTASNLVVARRWFVQAGGFSEALSFAEDQDFVARLIKAGGKIDGIDAVLTGYRFSPDGLSMDLERMHAGWRSVALQFVEPRELAALDALYCRYLARRVLRAGARPTQALGYVIAGLRLDSTTFLKDRRRGLATVAAALLAPAIPGLLRQRLFA